MEKHYEFDNDLYMIFVDYKQAYGSINREVLWKSMVHFGMQMINFGCNNKTVFNIKFLGELSLEFEVNSGLCQGEVLSPTLFNLGIEKVIRKLNRIH